LDKIKKNNKGFIMVERKKIRKMLSSKIQQLNEVIADMDVMVTELETEFYRVCIFGSARIGVDSVFYQQAFDLAKELAMRGVDIVTGGGPGLMEAANRGAKEGCNLSRSIGLPIQLPFESDANAHLDVKHHHRRFSSRLDEFMRISHAVVITPGGIGTMLELFYTWQLMQVNHIKPRPFILLGREMFQGLIDYLENVPTKHSLMSRDDMRMIKIVDSVEEVVQVLEPHIDSFRKLHTQTSRP
jgi:uncharacterized protein (TIGR00730 family)